MYNTRRQQMISAHATTKTEVVQVLIAIGEKGLCLPCTALVIYVPFQTTVQIFEYVFPCIFVLNPTLWPPILQFKQLQTIKVITFLAV